MSENRRDEHEHEPTKPPGARESQRPIGEYESREGNWLTGDDPDDPLREEAAERARRAVEPGRPRE
jgi:hypothetical protein